MNHLTNMQLIQSLYIRSFLKKSPALSFKLFTGEYNCKDNHYL